jgi:hypothetical protein
MTQEQEKRILGVKKETFWKTAGWGLVAVAALGLIAAL